MPYFKVNPQTGEILSEQLTVPPDEVHGLADESLADLGATFPDRPEYQGVGYWPETRQDQTLMISEVAVDPWVPVADMPTRTIISKQTIAPKPLEAIKVLIGSAVDNYTNTVAVARGYTSIVSACSYIASGNAAWKADAQAAIAWRDAVWAYVYQLQADVVAGTATVPEIPDLLAALPKIGWP